MSRKFFKIMISLLFCFSLVSCTQNRIADDIIKQDIISFLNTFSFVTDGILEVKAQRFSNNYIDVDTSFVFADSHGTHSTEMTLTYGKTSGKWLIKNHRLIRADVKTSVLIYDFAGMEAFIKENPTSYFEMDFESHFIPENLHFKSETKISDNAARVVFDYSATALNWTFNETYTLMANYIWPNDWTYVTEDWSYIQTNNWAGTWKIEFHKPDGTLAETINNIVITGELSYTENKAGDYQEKNTLLVDFTRKGKHYSIPAKRQNGGTAIILELGGSEWIILGIMGVIDDKTGAVTGYVYYTANTWYESGNVLTKVN